MKKYIIQFKGETLNESIHTHFEHKDGLMLFSAAQRAYDWAKDNDPYSSFCVVEVNTKIVKRHKAPKVTAK